MTCCIKSLISLHKNEQAHTCGIPAVFLRYSCGIPAVFGINNYILLSYYKMKHDYILLNVDKPYYVYEFHPKTPLVFTSGEVGLKNFFLWYTYPNISEKYDNNKLHYTKDGSKYIKEIPTGMYDIAELNKFLATNCDGDISLQADPATFKCYMMLKEGVNVDFTVGRLHELLGFESKVFTVSSMGSDIINITRGVDRILIRCSLIERPYQNEFKDCLYDILPVGNPGSAIYREIENVEFHKCKDSVIRRIEIRITDSKNNLIDFKENISLKLVFRSEH